MKKIMIAAAVLAALTACNKTLIECPVTDPGYGYINLDISSDTEMVETRTTTKPIDGSYSLCLQKKNTNNEYVNYWTTANFSDIQSTDGYLTVSQAISKYLTVPSGEYKLIAENIKSGLVYKSTPNGQLYVYGEKSFTVNAGVSNKVTFQCEIKNSKVTVHQSDNFGSLFNDASITLKSTTTGAPTSLSMNWYSEQSTTSSSDSYNEAFYPAESVLSWELIARTSLGIKKYVSTQNITTAAKQWTKITFSPKENGKGSINLDIIVNDEFGTPVTVTEVLDPIEGGELITK
jgi:hypothetical protein